MLFIVILAAALALYWAAAFRAVSKTEGEITLAGLQAPVQIIRDDRDIPHIRAQNEHDLFFGQGFAEGSDRLFQMDLTRHFVYGRLSEWFGNLALSTDERSRTIDVRGIIEKQWAQTSQAHRDEIQAFSDGINAAMDAQPVPFEYRFLFAKPERWQPQDSLAVGFATVLDLADSYRDVLEREEVFRLKGERGLNERYPLTDPKYDVPIVAKSTMLRQAQQDSPRRIRGVRPEGRSALLYGSDMRGQNSNEWAVGANRSLTGHALLANDPHLDLGIPGIWYLVDLQAPGYHAAGASLSGTPGIILGHNDNIAWGATNGTVAAVSLFHTGAPPQSAAVTETFHVRLGGAQTKTYYREPRGFYVEDAKGRTYLAQWSAYSNPVSPLGAFDGLDRARTVDDAIAALNTYPGPTQNFVVAGSDGRAGYMLAGQIPNDPLWARRAHNDAVREFAPLPYGDLPHVTPSRDAVVFTANNKMYGAGYKYRLSATFAPPYRAYRIHQMLQARKRYDVAYFTKMQNDTSSPAELEFARQVVASTHHIESGIDRKERVLLNELRLWDGRFTPESQAATLVHAMRLTAVSYWPGAFSPVIQGERKPNGGGAFFNTTLRLTVKGVNDTSKLLEPWRVAGAVPIRNPLHAFGISWLDGQTLPGNGDSFTIHAQNTNFNQSFRAVWDVGNWDRGGIVIPAGESGQPASAHYQDLTETYVAGALVPLPFTDQAVNQHASARLTLSPAQPSAK